MPIQLYHLADIPSSTTYPARWQTYTPRFTLSDVARIAGRVASGAATVSRVATPIGIASVVAEGLVIGGLKILEAKPTALTQEQQDLANAILDAQELSAENVFQHALYILESNAASGALQLMEKGFADAQDVLYSPEGVNVAHTGIDGVIITTAPRPNGIVLSLAAPDYAPIYMPEIRVVPGTPFIFPDIPPPAQEPKPTPFVLPPLPDDWEYVPMGPSIPIPQPSWVPTVAPATVPDRQPSVVTQPLPSVVPTQAPAIEIPLAMPEIAPVGAPNTIPVSEIAITPRTGLDIEIAVNPNIEPAIREENTKRKDKKPRGMLYLAMLRLINRTWGTLTELDDFSNVVQNNLTFENDVTICVAEGQCILVRAGQKFSEIPLKYKAQVITQLGVQGIPVNLDYENFAWDLLVEELTDTAIGLASTGERMLINKLGLRGPLDYGNVTTWWNRVNRILNTGEDNAI